LHQKIGATSQDARSASGGGKCADRFIERAWRQVSDIRHGRSRHFPYLLAPQL
jgi:hypothetical protein